MDNNKRTKRCNLRSRIVHHSLSDSAFFVRAINVEVSLCSKEQAREFVFCFDNLFSRITISLGRLPYIRLWSFFATTHAWFEVFNWWKYKYVRPDSPCAGADNRAICPISTRGTTSGHNCNDQRKIDPLLRKKKPYLQCTRPPPPSFFCFVFVGFFGPNVSEVVWA